MGRRKIRIQKIEDQSKRFVTFSKRRQGIFQKAAELFLRCKAQVAILVFSPNNRAYTFSHSSADAVIQHFLDGTVPGDGAMTEEHRRLVKEIEELDGKLKKEKKLMEEVENMADEGWLKIDDQMSLEELEALARELKEKKEEVQRMAETLFPSAGFDVDWRSPLLYRPDLSAIVDCKISPFHDSHN